MNRTARAAVTAVLAGLVVVSGLGMPVQATSTPEAAPQLAAATAAAKPVPRVTLSINSAGKDAVYAGGEKLWVRGQVRDKANKPVPHEKVTLYSYVGGKRKTLAHPTSNANGTFTYSGRPAKTMQFRATYGDLVSPKVTAKRITQARTLGAREKELEFLLGAAKQAPQAFGSGIYRKYAHGTLVQTGSRTWLVRGEILTEYLRRDGVKGKLGVPQADEKCRLMEGACLQRFSKGTVYTNKHAKDRTTSAVATGPAADLVATALSQVGYREPSPRKSKYNKWIHRTGVSDAWCGYFAAWVSVASGHGSAVVKAKTFAGMVSAEKKRHRLKKSPAIGRLAYIDYFRNGKPTHVGIVYKFSSKHIWTIEGNVSAGGGSQQPRGVHKVMRSRSRVVTYASPRW